jgi:hypothetical protein
MIMARLPFAASNLPDIKSLVERHGVGMIFNETDPTDIARVIHAMLEPDTHALFKEAVKKAAAELCWENEGRKFMGVFQGNEMI